jgi:guanine deaminase
MNNSFIIKGDICFSQEKNAVSSFESHYIVCVDGLCRGVFPSIPSEYSTLPLVDYCGKLVIPGLVDLHIHAPQYSFRGRGMDLELLDWLNEITFPEESKYSSLEYAGLAYRTFSTALKKSATTRACIFSTIHVPATELLMDLLEDTGLVAYVGKVNMDRNSPPCLKEESAIASAKATLEWLEYSISRYKNIKPIITPRFIPSCSDELMEWLGRIQKELELPVQSHLSEAKSEIEWVMDLCRDCKFYGEAYDRYGLFGGAAKTIMAHCVHSSQEEIQLMKKRGVFVAHCPESNINLKSGLAPIRKYMDEGLHIGLGSDIAAGTSESIFSAMAEAIKTSKLRYMLLDSSLKPLTSDEAFYLATKGGGEFFGKVGSFENGYELDALVIDDSALFSLNHLSPRERLERLIYLSNSCSIEHKYVQGKKLF